MLLSSRRWHILLCRRKRKSSYPFYRTAFDIMSIIELPGNSPLLTPFTWHFSLKAVSIMHVSTRAKELDRYMLGDDISLIEVHPLLESLSSFISFSQSTTQYSLFSIVYRWVSAISWTNARLRRKTVFSRGGKLRSHDVSHKTADCLSSSIFTLPLTEKNVVFES